MPPYVVCAHQQPLRLGRLFLQTNKRRQVSIDTTSFFRLFLRQLIAIKNWASQVLLIYSNNSIVISSRITYVLFPINTASFIISLI